MYNKQTKNLTGPDGHEVGLPALDLVVQAERVEGQLDGAVHELLVLHHPHALLAGRVRGRVPGTGDHRGGADHAGLQPSSANCWWD